MTSLVHVQRHATAAAFLERAQSWLMQREAEHNLILGLADQLQQSRAAFDAPIYLATVEGDDGVVGCVFRTPPFKLGLTRMPLDAMPAVVADVAAVYESLPAVLGPEPETSAFAALWSELRGVHAREGMRNRIYQLERVTAPARLPPGRMRSARVADAALIDEWLAAFATEAHTAPAGDRPRGLQRIRDGRIFVWDDDGARCMVGIAAETPNGRRVGPVYTPPEWRGRGYAAACTAAVSQHILDSGKRFCFLYTDLANPTSNAIYQKIGYQPVCDVGDWVFDLMKS